MLSGEGRKSRTSKNGEVAGKHEHLKRILSGVDSVIVAFSGGVDSAVVLKAAYDVLGERALGVTADSPALPRSELALAREIADNLGVRHIVVRTTELKNEHYRSNPANRCYFCKTELYTVLKRIAQNEGVRHLANGTNIDDLGDYRPGLKAADEFRVISPLRDASMTKADVRSLAQELGLPVWDKPASPCLASRIPYGSEVTVEKLGKIELAEDYLRGLGIRELRVRHFGEKARIEVSRNDKLRVTAAFNSVTAKFRAIGFEHIEIAEFRSGSLNTVLRTNQTDS